MKGLFMPDITVEMFKRGRLTGIEGYVEAYDIDYPLEQEPCEDYISRTDVIKTIISGNKYGDVDVTSLLREVKNIPSVQPNTENKEESEEENEHWFS